MDLMAFESIIERLPVAFTGPGIDDLRVLRKNDPILTDPATGGSLFLLDPASTGVGNWGWQRGDVTTPNIPNVARDQAAALLATSPSSVDAYVGISADYKDDSKGRFERTSKGGLHGLVRKQAAQVSGSGVALQMDTAVRTYLRANLTHMYYFSVWGRWTRERTGTNSTAISDIGGGSTSDQYALLLGHDYGGFSALKNQVNYNEGAVAGNVVGNVGQPFRTAVRGNQTTTQIPSTLSNAGVFWSAGGGAFNYNEALLTSQSLADKMPSFVLYRMYLEDLTVSGRAHADVAAIDSEMWQGAFNNGGRFYGDTWTDPLTLP